MSMYQNLNRTNTNINEVAFSGSYTDLANTPVISTVGHSRQYSDVLNPPARVSQFANDANYAIIGQKVSEFQNDAQYTVNGSNISQFSNNSNYAIRGKNVSEFANNANYANRGENVSEFATNANYAIRGENVSEFANNAGSITASQVPSNALQVQFQQNTTTGTVASGGHYGNLSCSGDIQIWHASGTVCVNTASSTNANLVVNGSTICSVNPNFLDNGDCQAYPAMTGITQLGGGTYSPGVTTNKGVSNDINQVSMTEYVGANRFILCVIISHHDLPWHQRGCFPECKHFYSCMSIVFHARFSWCSDFVEQKSVSTTCHSVH